MRVFVENEAGTNTKNIFNEETPEYSRSHQVSASYPFPYGFLLDTKSGDGDNVDCFLLTNKHLKSGDIVDAEPIGMYEDIEDGKEDHKILAVLAGEKWQVDKKLEQVIRDFSDKVFSHLPGKKKSIGRFLGKEEALQLIADSRK
jgi:inorganic pyrophosphatase